MNPSSLKLLTLPLLEQALEEGRAVSDGDKVTVSFTQPEFRQVTRALNAAILGVVAAKGRVESDPKLAGEFLDEVKAALDALGRIVALEGKY